MPARDHLRIPERVKTIRIGYDCMWGAASAFSAETISDCFPCLRPHYRFELSDRPEVAFYSVYGYVTKRFNGARRLVYSGEPGDHFGLGAKIAPGVIELGFFDYGITCAIENTSPNHFYWPQGFLHLNLYNGGVASLVRDGSPAPAKKHFADFIYSNGYSRTRVEFMQALGAYRRVECCGAVARNNDALTGAAYSKAGYLLKQAFQSGSKFSIAFENTYFPGYTTEKITDPLLARSVPIYSGNPRVAEVFNPQAFINVDRCPSFGDAIAWIREVDQDEVLYQGYLGAPPFPANQVPARFTDDAVLTFFQKILNP